MPPRHGAAVRRPSASPAAAPVWRTLALLLCLLQRVTSSPTLLTPSHHRYHTPHGGYEVHPGPADHQTFLREGVGTTPGDPLLAVNSDQAAEASVTERTKGKVLTKGTQRSEQRGGRHLSEHSNTSGSRMNGTAPVVTLASHGAVTKAGSKDLDPSVTHTPYQRAAREELDSPVSSELEQWAGHQSHRVRRGALHGPLWTDKRTLFVELVVLADWSMWRKYSSGPAVQNRVREVVNVANAILNRVGVVVILTEVKVWRDGDKFRVSSDLLKDLEPLRDYRERLKKDERRLANDNTVLLTRVQMKADHVGMAYTGTMCDERLSVSVVQDVKEDPATVGYILAHEMGHNLGMKHDENASTILGHPCSCSTKTCVMQASVSEYDPSSEWSSCSRGFLKRMLKTSALDCLKNVPTQSFPGNSCGDGVVDHEAGEQCDCGPPEYCDNPCCLASTCKLAANASCASGSCCDTETCQPQAVGTVCRLPLDDCDLPEYCSGHSEYCPTDLSKIDGTPCREGKGRCYRGECASHEGRCQYVWGPEATEASPTCYSDLNTEGTGEGNCGKYRNLDQLLRCTPESSRCGTLHCLPPSVQATSFHAHHYNGTKQVGPHSCAFITASSKYPSKDWLSPDGATCGQGKMCVNQRCVEVPPPGGHCRDGCSGRGVCNSLGHCHCDAGYAPPNCSRPGLGGSIDSGVMIGVTDNTHIITTGWVLLVSLLALLVVICCVWGYLRSWWKRRGRSYVSPILPCCVTCLDACCCPVVNKATHWVITVGSSRKKKQDSKKEFHPVDLEGGADEAMLCAVDVDIKQEPQTNSWGVADEKLVTDVITVTPKNSPDLRRKVHLPSSSPVLHHKSVEVLDRPKYFQSMSVDSGCVSDGEDGTSSIRSSLHMSMRSLISTLRRIGTTTQRDSPEKDNQPPRTFGSQKSMPLSRFVVDPLAGNRSSRQGTPPPDHMRPAFRRSVTVDATPSAKVRWSGLPQPPPANLKPHKSEDNLKNVSKAKKNPVTPAETRNGNSHNSGKRKSNGVNRHSPPDIKKEPVNQPTKRPMMPHRKSLSPLKVSPPKESPPPPPSKQSRSSNASGSPTTNIVPQHSNTAFTGKGPATNGKSIKSLKTNRHSGGGQKEKDPVKTTATTRDNPKKNVKSITQKFEAMN
ncbi:uncharacterized protein [Panulirus ornatus]|uniref:uncharacterized protein isoform X2 n=1 Tax=Panulirus ornatus TaxID=150431 RepID=UPI003A86D8EF